MSAGAQASGARDQNVGGARALDVDELGAIWDVPSTAIVIVDGAFRIQRANRAFSELVAETATSLPGRPLREVAPLMAGPLGDLVTRVLASGEPAASVPVSYNFAQLSVDAIPIAPRGRDPRVALILADTRRRPMTAPDGASGARLRFFQVARRIAGDAGRVRAGDRRDARLRGRDVRSRAGVRPPPRCRRRELLHDVRIPQGRSPSPRPEGGAGDVHRVGARDVPPR
jgi:PAS domain-containing protein